MDCLPISGTNILYLDPNYKLDKLKENDYLQIQNLNTLFQIQSCFKVNFSFPVEIKNKNIYFKDNFGCLFKNDEIKIVYDAYEIGCCIVLDKGTKFLNGQDFGIAGNDLTITGGLIEIVSVDGLGRIEQVKIKEKGIFSTGKSKILNLPSQNGKNAQIEVIFESIGKKSKNLRINHIAENYICCNELKLEELENPIIYFEKYQIKINSLLPEIHGLHSCMILSEFTPNFSMPLLSQNSLDSAPILNKNFITLDLKIKELENRIFKLENL